MKRLEVKVEPLSDERWDRIEHGLLDKLAAEDGAPTARRSGAAPRTRAPRAAWAVVAAVAAVLVLALGLEVFSRGSHSLTNNPSRIATGASDSHVVLGANSADVAPESTLLVSGDDEHGMLLVLERGRVTCEIAPRRGRPPIVVAAGDTRVRVIGTRFTVTRVGDTARVDVAHGAVEVSAHGATVVVRDGESWPPAPTGAIAPSSDPVASAPVVASAPASAAPIVASAPASAAPTDAPSTLVPAARPKAVPSNAPRPDEPAPAPSTAPAPTPQELFETAARLEATNPSRAIALYAQVAAGGGAWAANALFAQARLEALRGNRGEASRLLEAYLARYPRGTNAADARALLERLR